MKEEKQRIAIAEICGLFRLAPLKRTTRKGNDDPNGVKLWYCVENFGGAKEYAEVPFYLSCLNAMHKAVSIFDYDQADEFDDHLCDICKRANDLADNPTPWRFAVTNATAKQRAEAFLRVFGKWEETE